MDVFVSIMQYVRDLITIGILEENKVLKEWYIKNGFVCNGTRKFEHLPFTVGFMSCKIKD